MGKTFRCLSYALIGVALILGTAQTALAHIGGDPPGATGTGVTLELKAFRDAAATIPVLPGAVTQCETIFYQATLKWAGPGNAALEGGTLVITLPDASTCDATNGPIPCLGGTTNGCTPGVEQHVSSVCSYTFAEPSCPVPLADRTASVRWSGGFSHTDPHTEADASIGIPLNIVCCTSDNLACNGLEFCDPFKVGAFCSGGVVCDDADPPTGGDGVQHTGTCAEGDPVVCTDDGNACTSPLICTEPGGTCVPEGLDVVCTDLFCTPLVCDPADGVCRPTGPEPDCDDLDACTDDICNEETNVCDHDPTTVAASCDPNCQECDTTTGLCVDLVPLPDICTPGEEICRTPGFWGTHAGTEKEGHSTDITGTLLAAFNAVNDPDLTVCGAQINDSADAMQAICVSPKGNSDLQLARQLTAAALNCIISNGGSGEICTPFTDTAGAPCGGTSIEALWNACNAICDGDPNTPVTASVDFGAGPIEVNCIGLLDCFNNGLTVTSTGECSDTLSGCHERDLDNGCAGLSFVPPGAAGSPGACNTARKDCTSIFGPIPGCTP